MNSNTWAHCESLDVFPVTGFWLRNSMLYIEVLQEDLDVFLTLEILLMKLCNRKIWPWPFRWDMATEIGTANLIVMAHMPSHLRNVNMELKFSIGLCLVKLNMDSQSCKCYIWILQAHNRELSHKLKDYVKTYRILIAIFKSQQFFFLLLLVLMDS